MIRPLFVLPLRWHWNSIFGIAVVELRRRDVGWVRQDKADEEHPGTLVVGVLTNPGGGTLPVRRVVPDVGGVARARLFDARPFVALRGDVPDTPEDVPLGRDDVQGVYFLAEPVVVPGLTPEMKLPDGVDPIPLGPDRVVPTRCLAVVGLGVVPITDLMDVPAGCQGGSRGYANRTIGVGSVEPRPPFRYPIDVGSGVHRMSVATAGVAAVLVGQNKHEIRWFN